ncbi:MAG: hypothetical protein HMLKMBBP_02511 [Planctomycetes bacterium]|nr:hypothetical protein [Planctomycetota bacterium]
MRCVAVLLVSGAVLFPLPLAAEDPARPAPPAPRWIVGDLHVHVSPPDEDGHSKLTVASAIERAVAAKLDFIVLTPHGSDRSFPGAKEGAPPRWGQDVLADLAREALAARRAAGAKEEILVVPGWEFTRPEPGHLGMSFFAMDDVAKAQGDRKAEIALGKGAFVVVNHPFFRPVRMAPEYERLVRGLSGEFSGDWRWLPFHGRGEDPLCWNGIEVWHERSVLVQKLHAGAAADYPQTQMARAAVEQWDRSVREQRRRVTAVGGSDCHGRLPYAISPQANTAALVDAFDLESLRAALVGARVTFGRDGGAAAGDLSATSDVPGERAGVGGSLRAEREVRLSWSGEAALFEDGIAVGTFTGGAVRRLEPPGSFRAWRIEKAGDAFSNHVHANLPAARSR